MSKRKTTTEFITDAQKVHGDKFDYSHTVYKGAHHKITIVCPAHGEQTMTASNHLRGSGCKRCGYESTGTKLGKPAKIFIDQANRLHNRQYDYSKVDYVNNATKVIIICPDHGEFHQTPTIHLRGSGCKRCAVTNGADAQRKTTKQFINQSVRSHGEKYDYSKSTYTGANDLVTIGCPIHGEFQQVAYNHINGAGCHKCNDEVRSSNRLSNRDEFIHKSVEIHGDRYDYTDVVYENSKTPVSIRCNDHGTFHQSPNKHLSGHGCPKCRYQSVSDRLTSTTDEFINKSIDIHGNRYAYPDVVYVSNTTPVAIQCPTHGEFYQTPQVHLRGSGCSRCVGKISNAEVQIFDYVNSLCDGWTQSDHTVLGRRELDMVNHDRKIAIEYCGLHWHSELIGKSKHYHLDKLLDCSDQNYRLITIFENEWLHKPDIVKSRLSNILGKSTKSVGARNLSLREIDWGSTKRFLDAHHIQSAGAPSSLRMGAFLNETLVGVMTMSKGRAALGSSSSDHWELVRFSTDGNTYAGMASRLFKRLITDNDINHVVSYADRRWSNGGLYDAIGFTLTHSSAPNYWYFKSGQTVLDHRYKFRKSVIVDKLGGDMDLSEWENMKLLGYDRIWDCGNLRYDWYQ